VKGALGHWIAGAGALGAACAHDWIVDGAVHPIAGLRDPDPRCALPVVMSPASRRAVDVAMVNAFGFGGANVSLVLARCDS
jgi:3-oxoacyl-[acyl-carrier-protein] synthase II